MVSKSLSNVGMETLVLAASGNMRRKTHIKKIVLKL